MTLPRKQFLLEKVEEAIKESKAHVERAEGLFRAYQNASRSEEGDRAHAEASFDLAKTSLKRLENFKNEILATNDLPPEKVEPICYVIMNDREFYFANENIPVSGVLIIGKNSPLGKSILGKSVCGTILSIE